MTNQASIYTCMLSNQQLSSQGTGKMVPKVVIPAKISMKFGNCLSQIRFRFRFRFILQSRYQQQCDNIGLVHKRQVANKNCHLFRADI